MKFRTFVLLSLLGGCALAQQQSDTTGPIPATAPGPNPLVTLASEFFEHNYFNVYGFGDAVLDSNNPTVNSAGQAQNGWGTGFEVGGGVNASHAFRDAQLVFGYSGSYRNYQSNLYQSGSSQNLNLGYSKRLTRHLSMNVGVGAGILLYGGTFSSNEINAAVPVISNPFSPETRYLGANLGFTYQQTRRLSYSVFGSFYLTRYNFAGAIGTTGASGGASVNYRLTARTTISGNYSHSYFNYQQNVGNDGVDQVGLSLAHTFSRHWTVSVFGGGARSNANGILQIPVIIQAGNQTITGYVLGPYHQIAYIPSFSGSLSHSYRRSVFSVSAGEGIAGSGNGYFLASRNIYVNGVYSYSLHGQNISVGGSAYRLSSVANTVSSSYSSAIFSASYGRMLIRYVGLFARYDYNHWGGAVQSFSGISDNRISFGLNFTSKGVPMTLF